MIQSIYISMAW